MWCGRHQWLHLFIKLPIFACRKLLQIYVTIIDGLGNKFSSLRKKQENISMQENCSFCWVLGKRHLGPYIIVPVIYRMITLSESCRQVNSGPHFIGLWLAKIFMLGPNCIQAEIFYRQAPWHILIHSKVSTPHYDFLALFRLR